MTNMEKIINKTRIALRSLLAELLVKFRNVGCFLLGEGDVGALILAITA
jgi:hypothetical protein